MKTYRAIQFLVATRTECGKVQRKRNLTLLEYLSNEIFVQILSYLNPVDAVLAFSYINNHFQCLLFEYWPALRFSNDDDTRGQIQYFAHNFIFTPKIFLNSIHYLS
jgi:hypothetical protein